MFLSVIKLLSKIQMDYVFVYEIFNDSLIAFRAWRDKIIRNVDNSGQ